MADKTNNSRCLEVAELLGLDLSDVKRAVWSFFDSISVHAKRLPFDNRRRIYTADSFSLLSFVRHIPFVGRLGPVYSRYLLWRSNELNNDQIAPRSSYRHRWKQSELETMAADILSGKTPSIIQKRKKSELYDTIWIVGKDGKKLARQVIKKDDVQD